jgi:hypothetical protein
MMCEDEDKANMMLKEICLNSKGCNHVARVTRSMVLPCRQL